MIKKLDRLQGRDIYENTALAKLNEVIDAVNSIVSVQEKLIDSRFVVETKHEEPVKNTPEDMGYIKLDNDSLQKFLKAHPEYNNNGVIEFPKKAPADPYTEQRKWIGKLCKFWDDDAFVTSNDWAFGILTSIDKGMQYQYSCNENCNFKHCEPVKPDGDIIYKGGDDD